MTLLDGPPRPPGGPSRARPHGNLHVLRLAVFAVFAILVARLFDMQIVKGDDYARRARENHLRATSLLPPRGLIVDRAGLPLVANVPVYAVSLVPEFLPEDEARRRGVYLWLETNLGIPALEVQQLVNDATAKGRLDQAVILRRELSDQEAIKVEGNAPHLPGIELTITAGRRYTAGEYFSHILGYMGPQTAEEYALLRNDGYQLNELVGKAGVESRYERVLRGTPGVSATEVDAFGRILEVLETRQAVPGNTLRLSIDADLQLYVADLLEAARGESPIAAAVVMDARTGAIYALVSIPTYDNNLFGSEERIGEYDYLAADPRRPLINHALAPSAPGSTFKLVTAAAALETGNIRPQTRINVSSAILEVRGENGLIYPFRDWRTHGDLDLTGAIAWSSNVYFYMASCGIPDGAKIGGTTLRPVAGLGRDVEESAVRLGYYARAFGFAAATGIDLDAAEEPGIIPSPEWKQRTYAGPQYNPGDRQWYYGDTCYMAVGQGDVLATPLQVARMTAAIANGGTLVTPHVADAVLDGEGNVIGTFRPPTTSVPVSPANLAVIRQGMLESVDYGAGALASLAGVRVAGKTGTAEFGPERSDGSRAEHGWFTGFAPYNNPEIVVTVYFELGIGGQKAAPVAARILDYYWAVTRQ